MDLLQVLLICLTTSGCIVAAYGLGYRRGHAARQRALVVGFLRKLDAAYPPKEAD